MLTTVISVMSRDRVGIVADVAARIAGLGGDLADLSQTTLRGFFTLIVIASFPDGVDLETVRSELRADQPGADADARLEIVGQAGGRRAAVPSRTRRPTRSTCSRCADPIASGLLADVTRICRDHELNILDLSTRASDGQYVTLLLVDASRAQPLERARRALEAEAATRGFAFTLQHNDVFRATHEIGA